MASPTVYNIYKAVAPSDTIDLPQPSDALWVGGAGNVAAVMQDGTVTAFTAVTAGAVLPIKARRVNAAGTSATLIVALYDPLMATRTARDLITASLKRLGVIAGIETPSADLADDALSRLNELVETWATESLMLWTQDAVQGSLLPPVSGASFTVGPNGNIDVPLRPPWIDSASWLLPGTPVIEYKLTALLKAEWENEQFKQLRSVQSTHYYYSADWPLGNLQLWPQPSVACTVLLYLPQPLHSAATLDTLFSVPQGYIRAMRDCLALELAPELGVPVNPALVQSATDAKSQIERINFRPRVLGMPPEIATGNYGGYDWRTD